MRFGVSAVMIVHNNEDRALVRLQRDLVPALGHLRHKLDAELIVIDNSTRRANKLATAVYDNGVCEPHYRWQRGANLKSGPALNVAAELARHPYLLYVCTNHGHSYDPSWPWDLLTPLINNPRAGMTGTLADAGPPAAMGFDSALPELHIQGGVFAARIEALRAVPYPPDIHGPYAHWGADVYESFALVAAGYTLVDVPTIHSVWRRPAGPGMWKYVHDEDDGVHET
jgi:hypothetical protein